MSEIYWIASVNPFVTDQKLSELVDQFSNIVHLKECSFSFDWLVGFYGVSTFHFYVIISSI